MEGPTINGLSKLWEAEEKDKELLMQCLKNLNYAIGGVSPSSREYGLIHHSIEILKKVIGLKF